MPAIARWLVNCHCCAFWLFLVIPLALGAAGAQIVRSANDGAIFSGQTSYDWIVNGAPTVEQKDAVNDAIAQAFPSDGRRRMRATLRRRLDEASSGGDDGTDDDDEEEETPAERSRLFSSAYSTWLLYEWSGEDGGDEDVWTAEALQQMCELENLVLGADGYGDVCYAPRRRPESLPNCRRRG